MSRFVSIRLLYRRAILAKAVMMRLELSYHRWSLLLLRRDHRLFVFLAAIFTVLLQLVGESLKNIVLIIVDYLVLVNFNSCGQTLLFLGLIPLFFLIWLVLGLL